MHIDFSGLFHQSSKDPTAGGTQFIPQDDSAWPEEWKTVHYKKYNLDKIKLTGYKIVADLFENIKNRRSKREYSRRPQDKDSLSALLKYSCGIIREDKWSRTRAQPSGGARYPIETYVVVLAGSEEVPTGIYHYDIKNHELDILKQREFLSEDLSKLFGYEFAKNASSIIVMTAIFARNQIKYGERGYRHILLEAGHIGQNLYLISTALGLGCCALSGISDIEFEKLLEIDGVTESVVYGLTIG